MANPWNERFIQRSTHDSKSMATEQWDRSHQRQFSNVRYVPGAISWLGHTDVWSQPRLNKTPNRSGPNRSVRRSALCRSSIQNFLLIDKMPSCQPICWKPPPSSSLIRRICKYLNPFTVFDRLMTSSSPLAPRESRTVREIIFKINHFLPS